MGQCVLRWLSCEEGEGEGGSEEAENIDKVMRECWAGRQTSWLTNRLNFRNEKETTNLGSDL